jgi:hypothetical protein
MDFTSILNFLTDKSRKISTKALVVIMSFVLLIIIDNTFSFSYFHNSSQKVNQLTTISQILKDTTLNKSVKDELLILQKDILSHKTLKDNIYQYLTNLDFETDEIEQVNKSENKIERDEFIHFLTSAWWIIIPLGLITILFPYIIITQKKQILNTTLGFVFIVGIGYLVSLLFSKILSFIPLIDNNPIYNYILNFFLSGLILGITTILAKKVEKLKKTITNA